MLTGRCNGFRVCVCVCVCVVDHPLTSIIRSQESGWELSGTTLNVASTTAPTRVSSTSSAGARRAVFISLSSGFSSLHSHLLPSSPHPFCRGPTSGSFVRPKKANLGVAILTAIERRYAYSKTKEAQADPTETDMSLMGTDNTVIPVKMIGAEKTEQKQRSAVSTQSAVLTVESLTPLVDLFLFSSPTASCGH
jgi:hypothetical protein